MKVHLLFYETSAEESFEGVFATPEAAMSEAFAGLDWRQIPGGYYSARSSERVGARICEEEVEE